MRSRRLVMRSGWCAARDLGRGQCGRGFAWHGAHRIPAARVHCLWPMAVVALIQQR